jgi:Arc/MetJ family transcription regulator
MAPSDVEVDADLVAIAAKIAAAHGETVELVVERALRAYIGQPAEESSEG